MLLLTAALSVIMMLSKLQEKYYKRCMSNFGLLFGSFFQMPFELFLPLFLTLRVIEGITWVHAQRQLWLSLKASTVKHSHMADVRRVYSQGLF